MWLASIAAIIPVIGGLVSLAAAVWTIFIIHWGLQAVMKPPEDKAVGYTAVVIIIWCVMALVVGMIVGLVLAPFMIASSIASHAL
jgi:hypothetical protein